MTLRPLNEISWLAGSRRHPEITTLASRSHAASCDHPAIAYCQGTPLRNEIEARESRRLANATTVAAEAIAHRFGRGRRGWQNPSTCNHHREMMVAARGECGQLQSGTQC